MVSSEPRNWVGAEPERSAPPAEPELSASPGEAAPGPAASAPQEATLEAIGEATAGAAGAAVERSAALRALRNLEATEARLEVGSKSVDVLAMCNDFVPVLTGVDASSLIVVV